MLLLLLILLLSLAAAPVTITITPHADAATRAGSACTAMASKSRPSHRLGCRASLHRKCVASVDEAIWTPTQPKAHLPYEVV